MRPVSFYALANEITWKKSSGRIDALIEHELGWEVDGIISKRTLVGAFADDLYDKGNPLDRKINR